MMDHHTIFDSSIDFSLFFFIGKKGVNKIKFLISNIMTRHDPKSTIYMTYLKQNLIV
jgi:hypothetical protein